MAINITPRIACFGLLAAAALAAPAANGPAFAASNDPAISPEQDVCLQVACRAPTTVRLWTDDGAVLEGVLPPGPYVLDGVINVLAGESLKVEATPSESGFLDLRYAGTDADPAKTLTVSLEQMVSDAGNEMIFSIENPLRQPVKFRLAANPPGSPDLIYTQTCPVAPGDWSFEKWPGPIAQLVVFDVQVLDADASLEAACD